MKAEDREIFGDFLEKIMKRFRCSSGSIVLCNGESKTFRVIASRGLKLGWLEKGLTSIKELPAWFGETKNSPHR